jgi:hypothetical protein
LQDNLALHAEHFPHTQGSKSAIYQFQIDNNNAKATPTGAVQFTAEISPGVIFAYPVSLFVRKETMLTLPPSPLFRHGHRECLLLQ